MYSSTGESTFSTVPAFLTKLWTLVEDPATDELICWDAVSTCFKLSNITETTYRTSLKAFRAVVEKTLLDSLWQGCVYGADTRTCSCSSLLGQGVG